MLALIRFELKKLVAQKKSLIGLLNIVLINALCSLGFYLENRRHATRPHPFAHDHLMGEFINAYQYTQFILVPSVFMLFPMVLAIMAAYVFSGEFEVGSLRMMLFRPVSRWQVLLAKFVALSVYAAAMLALLGVVSYTVGRLQLNPRGLVIAPGPMYQLGATQILTADEAPARIVLSYVLAVPMLMSVAAMALMFAVVTRHYTSAAILTSTVYFASYIIGALDMLSALHPFLPTRYWPFWKFAVVREIPWNLVGLYAGWTAGYTLVFLALGIALFNMRDV